MQQNKPLAKWDAIDELLNRGVDTIYPSKAALEQKLRRGEKIRLYLGVDPTGETLHIGHAVPLNKLRQFQKLGHEVILLIGDFTGMIGDPSGKTATRPTQTNKQALANAQYYRQQAGKILNFAGKNPIKIKYNSSWLGKLNLFDFLQIAKQLTFLQLQKRHLFKTRMQSKKDVFLHEFLYPVLQGYDSVAMEVDLEIGGSDQLFNMMVGRDLLKKIKNKEKFVLTLPLITDAAGKKIGKTEGNVIGITDPPAELYGKLMNLPDSAIIPCFELITEMPLPQVEQMRQLLSKAAINPMELKKKLAWNLVQQYNGKQAADTAQAIFAKKYQTKTKAAVAKTINLPSKLTLVDFILEQQAANSRGQAKRLIRQGGVKINSQIVTNINYEYTPKKGDIIEIGKHRVYKLN